MSCSSYSKGTTIVSLLTNNQPSIGNDTLPREETSPCELDESSLYSSIDSTGDTLSTELSSASHSDSSSRINPFDPSDPLWERVSDGIVPTENQIKNALVYNRIVIIGVDGVGGMFEQSNCPSFRKIFLNGNINYHGVSQYRTISAENWCSMMYGVTAQTHKKTNDIITNTKHEDSSLPSVIRYYSLKHPEKSFYSVVSWKPLNYGMLEDFDSLTKETTSDLFPNLGYYETDVKTCDLAIERIKTHDDTISFIHFVSVDGIGHLEGGNSTAYYNSIAAVDSLIGKIYKAYEENNKLESTLFICVSDHGQTPDGTHGGETTEERATTLAVYGDLGNIIKGTSSKYVTHDLASIVLYALGEKQPYHYEGGVPKNLFSTLSLV